MLNQNSGNMFSSRTTALLYGLTGVTTGIPVLLALLWAGSAYGPVSIGEYISILGSLILLIAAAQARADGRTAAWIALLGLVLVWSFYLPSTVGLVRMRLSDQRLTIQVLIWTPSSAPLTIIRSKGLPELTREDVTELKGLGITGTISYQMGPATYGNGKPSHALIVMQQPVDRAVDLREPDATRLVYMQNGRDWKIYPHNGRTLSRTIRIQPDWENPKKNEIMIELSTGARMGFEIVGPSQ